MTGRLGVTRASDEKWNDSWARESTEGERYKPLGSRWHLSRFLHLCHSERHSSPSSLTGVSLRHFSFSFYYLTTFINTTILYTPVISATWGGGKGIRNLGLASTKEGVQGLLELCETSFYKTTRKKKNCL